jgi:uncharacterized membrane protein
MFKSGQTKLLGVTSLLAVLSGALYYAAKGQVQKSGIFALFAAIPLLINLYTVHCVIFGRCTIYSWLLTIVFTIYAAGIFFTYGKLLFKKEEAVRTAKRKESEIGKMQKSVEESLGLTNF